MTCHLIKGMKLLFQHAHKTFLAYLILITFSKTHNLKVYETKCRLRIHMSCTWYATRYNQGVYTKLTDCFTFGMVFYLGISNNREEYDFVHFII